MAGNSFVDRFRNFRRPIIGYAVRDPRAAEEPESIRNVGRTHSRISDAAGSAPQVMAHQSSMCLSRAAWFSIGGP
jgi:hypothetical protein